MYSLRPSKIVKFLSFQCLIILLKLAQELYPYLLQPKNYVLYISISPFSIIGEKKYSNKTAYNNNEKSM